MADSACGLRGPSFDRYSDLWTLSEFWQSNAAWKACFESWRTSAGTPESTVSDGPGRVRVEEPSAGPSCLAQATSELLVGCAQSDPHSMLEYTMLTDGVLALCRALSFPPAWMLAFLVRQQAGFAGSSTVAVQSKAQRAYRTCRTP